MLNGIKVDETAFANMDHDDQMKSLFQAVITTNSNFCKQVPLCETTMDKKILTERKRKGKISLGLGSGGGVGAFAILEYIKTWFTNS